MHRRANIVLAVFFHVFASPLFGQKLEVKYSKEWIGLPAREPMVVEHPSGALLVSGYNSSSDSPQLWKSTDYGQNWSFVKVGTRENAADANSDVDMIVGSDGSIYFTSMRFDYKLRGDSSSGKEGKHVVFGVSRDVGETWQWSFISKTKGDDRPWIREDSKGGLHIIWNDGKGVNHSTSANGGKTWSPQERIYMKGGSSHIATGRDGRIAVRIVPKSSSGSVFHENVEVIALSIDHGKTWKHLKPPGERDWFEEFNESATPRWIEPLTWDPNGNLFYLWSEGKTLNIGKSTDNGQNWEIHEIAYDDEMVFYPYLTISSAGELACSWFSGFDDRLKLNVGKLKFNESAVSITKSQPLDLEIWARWDPDVKWTGGEYIAITYLKNGNLGMATPIQNKNKGRIGFKWWELYETD